MGRATPARELWRPVKDFEGVYEVSNLGRVRRLKPRQGTKVGSILGARPNRDGYLRVALCDKPRQPVEKFIHVLVLETFVGPCPEGMEACHDDGNTFNAALSNLRWDTPINNALDKRRHGTIRSGERHPNSKLTQAQVNDIRVAHGSQSSIAAAFGITQQTVSDIRLHRRWA